MGCRRCAWATPSRHQKWPRGSTRSRPVRILAQPFFPPLIRARLQLGNRCFVSLEGFFISRLCLISAIHAVQQAHRNYAKRQMTWFRREPNVTWMHGFGGESEVIAQAVAVVRNNLQLTS